MKENIEEYKNKVENLISNISDSATDYLSNSDLDIKLRLEAEKKIQAVLRSLNSAASKLNKLDEVI